MRSWKFRFALTAALSAASWCLWRSIRPTPSRPPSRTTSPTSRRSSNSARPSAWRLGALLVIFLFGNLFDDALNAVGNVFSDAFDFARRLVRKAMDFLLSAINQAKQWVSDSFGWITGAFESLRRSEERRV